MNDKLKNNITFTFQIHDIFWEANETMDLPNHTMQPCTGSECAENVTANGTTISVIRSTQEGNGLAFNISLITVAVIFTITIVFGNVTVLWAILKERKYHRKTDYFLGSLAVSGAYVGGVSVPLITQYAIIQKWLYGDILCKLWMISDWTMNGITQSTIYIITWDRYLSVTRPICYRNWKTESKVFKVIAGAWILNWIFYPTLILTVVPDEFVYDPDKCTPPFLDGPWITFTISIFVFWIFTFIMIYQYWVIYKVVRALDLLSGRGESRPVNPAEFTSYVGLSSVTALSRSVLGVNQSSNHIPNNEEMYETHTSIGTEIVDDAEGTVVDPEWLRNKKYSSVDADEIYSTQPPVDMRLTTDLTGKTSRKDKRKILNIISIICGVFLISWIPFYIMNSLPAFCGYFCVSDTAYLLITFVNYLNNAVNPYVYAYLNPRFREIFLNYWRCGKKRMNSEAPVRGVKITSK